MLNSFLQFLERDNSDSLIIAATNNHRMLDQALFRRFDDVIAYHLPDADERGRLLSRRLGHYKGRLPVKRLAGAADGLSHAEIALAVDDAIKDAILSGGERVDATVLANMLNERHEAKHRSEGS